MTIIVPKVTSPDETELGNQSSRVRIRSNSHAKKLRELIAKKSSGQYNTLDSKARIAMVLANEDFPAAADIDTEITRERLALDACAEAEQSLKAPLAAAKYKAATEVLKGLKPEHDKIVKDIVEPLAQLAHAYAELFDLGRQLKDKECGWRNGVGDLLPALIQLFGAINVYSPLAGLLLEAVKLNYLKASAIPKGLKHVG
jgi:hypothetical protein